MITSSDKINRLPFYRGKERKKFPFSLFFVTKKEGGKTHSFTKFSEDREEAFADMDAGLSLAENQDVAVHFDGPPDFR